MSIQTGNLQFLTRFIELLRTVSANHGLNSAFELIASRPVCGHLSPPGACIDLGVLTLGPRLCPLTCCVPRNAGSCPARPLSPLPHTDQSHRSLHVSGRGWHRQDRTLPHGTFCDGQCHHHRPIHVCPLCSAEVRPGTRKGPDQEPPGQLGRGGTGAGPPCVPAQTPGTGGQWGLGFSEEEGKAPHGTRKHGFENKQVCVPGPAPAKLGDPGQVA